MSKKEQVQGKTLNRPRREEHSSSNPSEDKRTENVKTDRIDAGRNDPRIVKKRLSPNTDKKKEVSVKTRTKRKMSTLGTRQNVYSKLDSEGRSIHEHENSLIKPGNEDYMSYYVIQKEWNPTKTVGLIGALSSSPGPAIVNLPPTIGDLDHDPRKPKAPAFKIGEKDESALLHVHGPGPAAYDVRKITNRGTDKCNAPFIGEKLEGYEMFSTPGPAKYHRGDSDRLVYRTTPAYSMRRKTERKKGFITPAPSSYTLPETLGPGRSPFKKSPCFTIAERLDKMGIKVPSPGPAVYQLPPTDINKPRAPAFSMRAKEQVQRIGDVNPGPASNFYNMVKFNKPSTPRFTFGIRHTPFEAFQHFAPGD